MTRKFLVLPLLLLLSLLLVGPLHAQRDAARPDAVETAREYRRAHESQILREYFELLRIPCVASDTENIRRNAEWIRDALVERGVEAELWTLDDISEDNTEDNTVPPIVYGRIDVPGAERTLGLYVHYDGQPVDPSQWTTPPWEPTLFSAALPDGGERIEIPPEEEPIDPEWRIYARAAGDDKAPIPAFLAVLDAFRERGIEPTSNLVFLMEGEEEAGSPHLDRYLRAHADELRADAWLIFDGPLHQSRRPQLVFGVRGYTGLDLTVYGAASYLHSGHYGNWAPNPAMELARLLASTTDADGNVVIEGFYDSSLPLSDADREALDTVPDVDEQLRHELGLARTWGAEGETLKERLLRPSFNVRGLESASVGDTARNIIPTTAEASIDVRLVAGNDPVEMLDLVERHIRRRGFHIVREEPDMMTRREHPRLVKVERREGYRAARSSLDSPIMQEIVRAADAAGDDDLVLVPSLGGSLPLYLFVDLLEAPVVITPIANHDDNQHAPDENLRLGNLWYGIDLVASLWTMP